MRKYADRICARCEGVYTPTASAQKRCPACMVMHERERQRCRRNTATGQPYTLICERCQTPVILMPNPSHGGRTARRFCDACSRSQQQDWWIHQGLYVNRSRCTDCAAYAGLDVGSIPVLDDNGRCPSCARAAIRQAHARPPVVVVAGTTITWPRPKAEAPEIAPQAMRRAS